MDSNRRIVSSGTTRAALIVMAALILSKITGQVREILIPSRIGFGALSDAFILGFLVPDLIYQLLVGGSIQAAITPTLSGAISNDKEKSTWRSISIFINVTAILMLAAVLIGELLIPLILPMISGDKSIDAVKLAISVSRMLFPQVFFMMLAALSIGILNAYKRFTISSLGPVVYNLGVIAAMLAFGNKTAAGVQNVAVGVLLSACLYFVMQFFSANRHFKNYVFSFNLKNAGFRKLVRLAIPTLVSASIVQLNLIILSGFANRFNDGSLTSMRFAITTWQLPYGVFAVAVGGVMLPTLAGYYASENNKAFSNELTKSIRNTLFLIIPSAVIFALLNKEVIRAIFVWGEGNMTEDGIALTASMLTLYCVAMICHSLIYLMNMSFYSVGKTKIPLFNGAINLISNIILCLIFTQFTDLGVVGMPLAYAISSVISAILLYVLFSKKLPVYSPRKIPQYLIKSFVCACSSALFIWLTGLFGWDSDIKIAQLLIFAIKAAAGGLGYFLMAVFLQMREPLILINKVMTRLKLI